MSYAPYPAYKDSGVPWFDTVPEHWDVRRLKDVSRLKGGAGFPLDEQNIEGEELYFYKVGDLSLSKDGVHLDKSPHTINRKTAAKLRAEVIPKEAICYAKIGAALLLNRRRITTADCCIDNNMTALLPNADQLNHKYAFYWMSTVDFGEHTNPGAVPSLSEGYQSFIPIAIPPIEEQTAIADFLDEKTTEIDDLIAKKEELLRLLAEQRTALITHAVTKGLNPNTSMKPSGIDWLGDVPVGWDVVPFKWCCQVQSGQVDPKLDEYKSLPLIAPDHIESGTGRLLPYESAEEQGAISGKYQFDAGEVLYSKIRPELSKVALAPEAGLCSADMYAIRALKGLRPEFLFFQMLSRHFHRFAVLESMRVAMPKINRESLGVFPVMIPDENTQYEILGHIETELAKMDLAEEKITTARDHLREYRSSVITNAVTGKIKVA
ncbi:restriction endonuclease subunit S [Leisingera sp. ANG-M1]|uniref:restriction endonuclease subunit S n=1 Tax=Leisingera sp. ANG-M1 TaxID=1577895 RepID=UPI000691C0A3|nr:restriction endonuclease subunit S [Leisingera sp. ANG-M1]